MDAWRAAVRVAAALSAERSADGEVPLASFQWAAATDPLDAHTLAAVGARPGVGC